MPDSQRSRCRVAPAVPQVSRVSSHRLRTCCAHYPGEQGGLHASAYPTALDGLRLMRGDSALAFNLSGLAQASLALRPVRSRPTHGGSLFPGLRRGGHPSHLPGSYQDVPTPPWAGLPPAALTCLSRHTLTHVGREGCPRKLGASNQRTGAHDPVDEHTIVSSAEMQRPSLQILVSHSIPVSHAV
jgi:hypothetical protein